VLRLDGYTSSSICDGVDKAAPTEVGRHVAVDEHRRGIAVASVPVVAAVEIDARRKARVVNIDPVVYRGLHVDGHATLDNRSFHHRFFHDDSRSDDWRADHNGASEDERCRGGRR
jgi:hypothetical protein